MQASPVSAAESISSKRRIAPGTLPSWTTTVGRALRGKPLEYLTTVHPCFIDGVRTLVHKRGLQQESHAMFDKLKA